MDGKVSTVTADHPNWKEMLKAIADNQPVLLKSLIDIPSTITKWFRQGQVTVQNGEVFYGSRKLGGVVVDRILDFIRTGKPVQPMLKFVEKLMSNPSHRAVEELYSFLEHKNLPITTDGNFLAYKGIQTDFYSITAGKITVIRGVVKDGKIYNRIGELIEVRRNEVDDNKERHCSQGIHAGSLEYATNFGRGGRVVIVEIDPADVVSIPSDCDCQKLRTCKYEVVSEYQMPLDSTYVSTHDEEPEWDDESDYDAPEELDEADEDYNNGFDQGSFDAEDEINVMWNRIRKISRRQRSDWENGYYDGYESVIEG
jgi:hypothetical protein